MNTNADLGLDREKLQGTDSDTSISASYHKWMQIRIFIFKFYRIYEFGQKG